MERCYGVAKMPLYVLFFLVGNVKAHCQDIEQAKKAIAISNHIYFEAFVKGDSSIFIDRYAKDACIMPPGRPSLCGKTAAQEFFRAAYNMGIRNGKFITERIFGDGKKYVTEAGMFQLIGANNVILDTGKFLVLWKYTAGGWKMFRDSFSSNLSKR